MISACIDQVLASPLLQARPPVLMDVGASAGVHAAWDRFAGHSLCVAFDADARDLDAVYAASGRYRRLTVVHAALSPTPVEVVRFHLTALPQCSSLLRPDPARCADWVFSPLFEVLDARAAPATHLSRVLAELGLDRVDWFKTDSQGLDLSLFQSLPEGPRSRALVAEFEPGFLPFYEGEEQVHDVLGLLGRGGWWLETLKVCGSQRVRRDVAGAFFNAAELDRLATALPTSPGWAEMTFLSRAERALADERDALLLWAIASDRAQHGFALELAVRGADRFGGALFADLRQASVAALREALARTGSPPHPRDPPCP